MGIGVFEPKKPDIISILTGLYKEGINLSKKGTDSSNSGIGFTGLLTILFIALKLTGVIDWSWFWVLSPILIPISIVVLVLIIIGMLTIITKMKKKL